MNDPALEAFVAAFLDRRDADPAVEPEVFVRERGGGARELAAIRDALAVLDAIPDASDASDAPRAIGAYRVLGEIGRGGMGIVFDVEAEDGRRFALKLLPALSAMQTRGKERFRREVEALARVDHPSIVGVHDVGEHGGSPFYVMDRVDGPTLAELADADDVQPARAARLVRDVAAAVQAAHDVGVLHRDIKPQNVIVRTDGTPILLDFGLVAADGAPTLTSTGDVLGTPRYMAPEQARGEPTDARTDVHGLGLLLYELVCGAPARAPESREAILRAVVAGSAVPPRRLRATVPPALEKIVLQAIAVDPARRYASARALADDLDRFLDGAPIVARPPSRIVRWRGAARRHPARVGLGILAVAAVLLVVWIATRPDSAVVQRERRTRVARQLDGALSAWVGRPRAPESGLQRATEEAVRALVADEAPAAGGGRFERLVVEGWRLATAGKHRDAIERLRDARRIDPDGLVATALLGIVARDADEIDLAARELVVASRLLPESAVVARALADVYERRRDFEDAVAEYRRATAIDPDAAHVWNGLARASYRIGDAPGAVAAARRAAALATSDDLGVLNNLAATLDRAGERDEARQVFRFILAREPDRVQTLFNLGRSLDASFRLAEARECYERCRVVAPGHRPATLCLAWLHTVAGERDAADRVHRDWVRAESLLIEALDRDRGRDKAGLRLIHDFAKRTRRTERLVARLDALASEGGLEPRAVRLAQLRDMLRKLERP